MVARQAGQHSEWHSICYDLEDANDHLPATAYSANVSGLGLLKKAFQVSSDWSPSALVSAYPDSIQTGESRTHHRSIVTSRITRHERQNKDAIQR